jgi:hypothetical protein
MTTMTRRALMTATACALPAASGLAAIPLQADPVPALVARYLVAGHRVNLRWVDEIEIDQEDALHQAWDEAFEDVFSEVATTPAGVLAHLRLLWQLDGPQGICGNEIWHEEMNEPNNRLLLLVMKAVALMLPAAERPSDDDLITGRDLTAAVGASVEGKA